MPSHVFLHALASMRPRVFPAEDAPLADRYAAGPLASMRPRVFPAEDEFIDFDSCRACRASMRPRVFPAEDPRRRVVHHGPPSRFNEAAGIPRGRRVGGQDPEGCPDASMRPRVFPAEDTGSMVGCRRNRRASMRPRVFPAEDSRATRRALRRASDRFNEAAGIPRGRHHQHPRSFLCPTGFNEAAGIPRGRPTPSCATTRAVHRFNEAAGIPRGRRSSRDRPALQRPRFNEAAGIPRGRPSALGSHSPSRPCASMRPRVFPAEDLR